jgi:hypothetical protein
MDADQSRALRKAEMGQNEPVGVASSKVAFESDTGPSFAGCSMSPSRRIRTFTETDIHG